MATDPGGAGGVYKRLRDKERERRRREKEIERQRRKKKKKKQGWPWGDNYRRRMRRMWESKRKGKPSGGTRRRSAPRKPSGGGGGGYRPPPKPKPPKKPAWWGEEWFGEGRAVEIKGLGTTNLREMQHFQNIDPLWRSWLEKLVQQSGAQGWWQDPQQSPLRWMAPVWSQM
jgi:hypothetical protein